jgi:hypothetical protein
MNVEKIKDFSQLMLSESKKTTSCYTCYTDLAGWVHRTLESAISEPSPTTAQPDNRNELLLEAVEFIERMAPPWSVRGKEFAKRLREAVKG